MAGDAALTRAQILQAADDLFYADGLASVSMDRIAERAGVTKKTLYYHFRSKDDLMGEYLQARRGPVLERYRKWAGTRGTVAERMRRMFRNLAEASTNPGWRGCGFIRAACELAHLPGHPAVAVARLHKIEFEAWLRSMLEEEGRNDSERLARALLIILDGAIVETLLHRRGDYALSGGDAVIALLESGVDRRIIERNVRDRAA